MYIYIYISYSRTFLSQLKKSGQSRFLLAVHHSKISAILRDAREIGLLTAAHQYFFTSLVGLGGVLFLSPLIVQQLVK